MGWFRQLFGKKKDPNDGLKEIKEPDEKLLEEDDDEGDELEEVPTPPEVYESTEPPII